MNWIDREIEEIKLDEGTILHPYKDTVGVWTAGVGHTKGVTKSTVVTPELVDQWLGEDIEEALRAVHVVFPHIVHLTGPRKGVLLNMEFNLGPKGLGSFKNTLRMIYEGDYDTAALNMLHSRWARQVGSRASRLAYRMRTNEYARR